MKTYHPKTEEMKKERKWHLIDASDVVLGQLATKAAVVLRGKNKPSWHPSVDCGDNVVVINAEKVALTGKKGSDKKYFSHSGYPGALKEIPIGKMKEKSPEKIVEKAIAGMLPGNRLKKHILSKLYVYAGENHPHASQNPKPLTIK